MSSNELIAIVPRLPPVVDGLGDYALSLARRLRCDYGIETRFIVGDPSRGECERVEGFKVSRLRERTADELMMALSRGEGAGVLLHYGGYAYAKRGCPAWLVEALDVWREGASGRFLLTLFHELYAKGPPWTSSFWLSRRQRSLTARLARLSTESLTSLELYGELLREMGAQAVSLPVFSSIGEPSQAHLAPLASRRRRMVVFGTRGRRAEVYRRSAEALNRICRELEIEEIWDIGRELEVDITRVIDLPVIFCGDTPASEVSEILLNSIAGVIDYPADMLAKSTIFAAYSAHRVLPLVAGYGSTGAADGLLAGTHYQLVNDLDELNSSSAQRIADAAFDWYQTHTLAVHAERLVSLLERAGFATRENLVHA